MTEKTKKNIKHCLSRPHDLLPGDAMGYNPGTANQRRYWLRMGWIEKRGMYVLTSNGYRELL